MAPSKRNHVCASNLMNPLMFESPSLRIFLSLRQGMSLRKARNGMMRTCQRGRRFKIHALMARVRGFIETMLEVQRSPLVAFAKQQMPPTRWTRIFRLGKLSRAHRASSMPFNPLPKLTSVKSRSTVDSDRRRSRSRARLLPSLI
jgi:hypothetical protein